MALRFAVGLCLAGIYPLGMKMIVQWVGGRPAAALGWLVGMLTLGTAMPHALRASGASWPWEAVLLASSLLALVGAALVAFLGDGPFAAPPRQPGALRSRPGAVWQVFRVPTFRASAFGYFGHMWELYAFWSVLPWLCQPIAVALARRRRRRALGRAAQLRRHRRRRDRLRPRRPVEPAHRQRARRCARAGRFGPDVPSLSAVPEMRSAFASPRSSSGASASLPTRRSSLRCHRSSRRRELLGSALVAQNGIGFLITVASILVLSSAVPAWGSAAMWILVPGPLLGLWALRPLLAGSEQAR